MIGNFIFYFEFYLLRDRDFLAQQYYLDAFFGKCHLCGITLKQTTLLPIQWQWQFGIQCDIPTQLLT